MEENHLKTANRLVVIGGSAGSLEVITSLLPVLKQGKDTAIILIVHRKNLAGMSFPFLLSRHSSWPVSEAEEKQPILPGKVYTTPPDYHLLIEDNKTFSLDYSEKVNFCRPSIDVTMESAACVYRENTLGVLLSGANEDGVEGLVNILKAAGKILIQDPAEADLDIMPRHAVNRIRPGKVYPVNELQQALNDFII
jgi:two-component system chemotaxis response regulator CheB